MRIEDLTPKLRYAVKAHIPKAVEEGYDTKIGAAGWCLEASNDFMQTLEDHGFTKSSYFLRQYIWDPTNKKEMKEQRKDIFLDSFPFDTDNCPYHFVVKIGKIVIDWSARQFGAENPFPAIWIE